MRQRKDSVKQLRAAFLVAALLVAALYPSFLSQSSATPSHSGTYVFPLVNKGYFAVVHHVLSNARSSIYASLLFISDPSSSSVVRQLLNDLVSAKGRGVDVRVLIEVATYDWGSSEAYEYLSSRGVDVRWDSPSKFTHTKLIVVDGETVILGSTNWSHSAIDRNNEVSVLINSSEIGQFYREYFLSLWKDSSENPNLDVLEKHNVTCLYNEHIYNELLSAISGASKRVHVLMYRMRREGVAKNLVDALASAAERGVDVKVVLEDDSANEDAYQYLQSCGAQVKFDAGLVTHAKLVICDDVVFVGDTNWESDYFLYTNTVGVLVAYKSLADYLDRYFQQIWESGYSARYLPQLYTSTPLVVCGGSSSASAEVLVVNAGYGYDQYQLLVKAQQGWSSTLSPSETVELYPSESAEVELTLSFESSAEGKAVVCCKPIAAPDYHASISIDISSAPPQSNGSESGGGLNLDFAYIAPVLLVIAVGAYWLKRRKIFA